MKKNLVAKASISIHAPPEQVWDALVNPDKIKRYMFGSEVVSDWKVGGRILWKGTWQGKPFEDTGILLRIEPTRLLQYTHFSPLSGLADVSENYHTVTVILSQHGADTIVTLTQDKNEDEEARAHSEKNWRIMLKRLQIMLETEDLKVDRF